MKTILKTTVTAFAVTIGEVVGIIGGLLVINDVHSAIKDWKAKREKEKEESDEVPFEDEELDFEI